MAQPSKKIFANNHDASLDEVFESRSQCLNYGWFLEIKKTGTDGNPKVLIEQSQNGVDYVPYIDKDICSDVIEDGFVLINEDVFAITDEFFHGNYYRVSYFANGTTTGTIDIALNDKIRS